MSKTCRCGGTFKRTDIVAVYQDGQTRYQDQDTDKATWKCDRCGRQVTQRKRQGEK